MKIKILQTISRQITISKVELETIVKNYVKEHGYLSKYDPVTTNIKMITFVVDEENMDLSEVVVKTEGVVTEEEDKEEEIKH